jgi:hypothetical protein
MGVTVTSVEALAVLSQVAVIRVVPNAFAVTRPEPLTVPMIGLDEFQMIVRP